MTTKRFARNTTGRATDYILHLIKDDEGWFLHNPVDCSDEVLTDSDGNPLVGEWKEAAKVAAELHPNADVRLSC